MTNEQEIVWLAGYLEGEGCFYKKKDCPTVMIQVASVDKDIIERVAKILNGPIRILKPRKESHQIQYCITIASKKAVGVMRTILPFMGQRRKAKIEELLEVFSKTKDFHNTKEEWGLEQEESMEKTISKSLKISEEEAKKLIESFKGA